MEKGQVLAKGVHFREALPPLAEACASSGRGPSCKRRRLASGTANCPFDVFQSLQFYFLSHVSWRKDQEGIAAFQISNLWNLESALQETEIQFSEYN